MGTIRKKGWGGPGQSGGRLDTPYYKEVVVVVTYIYFSYIIYIYVYYLRRDVVRKVS